MTHLDVHPPGSVVEVTDPDSSFRGQVCTVLDTREHPAPQYIRDAHPDVVSIIHRKVRNLLGEEAWVLGVAEHIAQKAPTP